MLTKIANRALRLNFIQFQSFSSQGHHHHEVHLDKNATWLKFKSNRKLVSFDGFIDTHVQAPGPSDVDPFVHLKENGIFSMENLVYNDPYYHDPTHQLHVTEPHGYITGDDPLDQRFDVMVPSLNSFLAIFSVLLLAYGLWDGSLSTQKIVDQSVQVQQQIQDRILGKNKEIQDLLDQIQEIQSKLQG